MNLHLDMKITEKVQSHQITDKATTVMKLK